ncbi:MAG: hypothetical protein INF90_01075 [Roseomonas sp.]|jgi:hypothetical protein|nr:hypothetical protein [Roseomonas sp.]
MPDAVDYAQELEERHRANAIARMRARQAAQAAQPPPVKKEAEDDA